MIDSTLLNAKQAAAYLQLSAKTLEKWRSQGAGPTFLKLGKKTIRYRRGDLDAWAGKQARTSTSAAPDVQSL